MDIFHIPSIAIANLFLAFANRTALTRENYIVISTTITAKIFGRKITHVFICFLLYNMEYTIVYQVVQAYSYQYSLFYLGYIWLYPYYNSVAFLYFVHVYASFILNFELNNALVEWSQLYVETFVFCLMKVMKVNLLYALPLDI